MPFFNALLEADGLSMPTMLPHLSLGTKWTSFSHGGGLFESTLTSSDVSSLVSGPLPTATAFLQAHPRKLAGLAAVGVSELLGNMPRSRRASSAVCRTDCLLGEVGCSTHEDFLFGSRVPFDSISPTQSMFVGWIGAARMTFKGDGTEETVEEESRGWSKIVPRSLMVFTAVDVVSGLIALIYRNNVCDVPLRRWLWGGILLGGPTDLFIKGLFWILKPRYKYYRMFVHNSRQAAGSEFEINSMEFFDEFGREVPTENQAKEGSYWMIQFRYPTMISSYRIVTHTTTPAANDPVTWDLQATNRKMTLAWAVIDEMDERVSDNMPRQRGTATDYYSDLQSLNENVAFRQAFLAEVFANAASFAWLVTGSAWIASGSETCVDSAPELWYYCFLYAVLTWSCLGTVTMGLIVSAVAMIVLGSKGGS